MISGRAIYDVLAATVPLYVAMMLSYVSVKRWKFFSPEQCSGINRFVAVFALPFLSFHLISSTDLYALNYRFIGADSLQKVVILGGLFLWQLAFRNKRGSSSRLEWSITLFSISTLPNTLLMGIPLLKAMYGDFCETLMVQIVVMQCVVWFTLLLFMFEYRGAMQLISEKFFDTAGSINSFRVDSDVVSLDGREPLQADAEIGGDGKMHVVVRRSTSLSASSNTPRISNLRGVEIYSVQSSKRNSFDGGLRGDVFSLQSSKGTNPRVSNFEEGMGKRRGGRSMSGKLFNGGGLVSPYPPPNPRFLRSTSDGCSGDRKKESGGDGGGSGAVAHINNGNDKELPMFLWSSSGASRVSEGKMRHAISRAASTDFGAVDSSCNKAAAFPNDASAVAPKAMQDLIESKTPDGKTINGENEEHIENRISKFSAGGSASTCQEKKTDLEEDGIKKHQMPRAIVMTRLILVMVWRKLIRNPNTYASLLGVVWSLISFRWGIKMPSIVKGSISIISDSCLGMAMFSLGLFMALQPKAIACGKSVATFAMATRFLMGPAVTAATSIAVGLRGNVLRVAILQAALPQGIVTFVFAKEYNVHADVLSTVIIFGMLIALPVTILYYVLLAL